MREVEYQVIFRSINDLKPQEIDDISTLYLDYYDNSSRDKVVEDLKNKNEILLLLADGEIVGFTTYEIYEEIFMEKKVNILFSGDTIVHHEHWGQQKLGFSWIKRVGEIYRKISDSPLYWFLIVKGHRTYRYLPAFANSFYPHWDIDRNDLKELLDFLAQKKFKSDYDKKTGVIHYKTPQGELKPEYAEPTDREKKLSPVKFFLERNPGFRRGDELACLCEIKDENFKPFTMRLMHAV